MIGTSIDGPASGFAGAPNLRCKSMTSSSRQVEDQFDPAAIDRKWQARWEKDGLHTVSDDDPRPKWYEMTMYPYPSGDLHIGHWYAMAPADCHKNR